MDIILRYRFFMLCFCIILFGGNFMINNIPETLCVLTLINNFMVYAVLKSSGVKEIKNEIKELNIRIILTILTIIGYYYILFVIMSNPLNAFMFGVSIISFIYFLIKQQSFEKKLNEQ